MCYEILNVIIYRRSTPVTPQLIQPPPAHQQSHNTSSRLMNMAYDLKVLNNPKTPTTVPVTTQHSTGPMDLSSGYINFYK